MLQAWVGMHPDDNIAQTCLMAIRLKIKINHDFNQALAIEDLQKAYAAFLQIERDAKQSKFHMHRYFAGIIQATQSIIAEISMTQVTQTTGEEQDARRAIDLESQHFFNTLYEKAHQERDAICAAQQWSQCDTYDAEANLHGQLFEYYV